MPRIDETGDVVAFATFANHICTTLADLDTDAEDGLIEMLPEWVKHIFPNLPEQEWTRIWRQVRVAMA